MPKLRILGLASREPSPFDGQWLVEYDPTRRGRDANGRPTIAHVVTSAIEAEAMDFGSEAEATECWRRAHGVRKDGQPNRPLTAFVVEVVSEGRRLVLFVAREGMCQPI